MKRDFDLIKFMGVASVCAMVFVFCIPVRLGYKRGLEIDRS